MNFCCAQTSFALYQSCHLISSGFLAFLIKERGHNIGRALYPVHYNSVRFPVFVHISPAFYKKREPRQITPARASVVLYVSTVLSGLVIVHQLPPRYNGNIQIVPWLSSLEAGGPPLSVNSAASTVTGHGNSRSTTGRLSAAK